jgi:hypothetical protein
MTDYTARLLRDIRLAYGEAESGEYIKVVSEFEAEVVRALGERTALVCLTTAQAVALWAVLRETTGALKYYREQLEKKEKQP